VDWSGRTVAFRLSAKTVVAAGKAIFRKGIKGQHDAPRTITLDGYAASHRGVRELKAVGLLPADTKLRSSKYLSNLIEQDHRGVKQRIAMMLGFKGLRDRDDHDCRHRIDASHPQGTIRTGTSGCSRSSCACSLECRPRGSKSGRHNTRHFQARDICTGTAFTRYLRMDITDPDYEILSGDRHVHHQCARYLPQRSRAPIFRCCTMFLSELRSAFLSTFPLNNRGKVAVKAMMRGFL